MNTQAIYCDCCRSTMIIMGTYRNYLHASCGSCGHERFLNPHNTICAELYENDADYNADLAIAQSHKDLLQWNHTQAISQLEGLFTNKRPRVLDIGCFNGFFVKELRDRRFDAKGIDFNAKALDFGHDTYYLQGHISALTLGELDRQGERFEAITILEVIEHVEDFASLIEQALRILLPNGVLILSTPNSNMIWRPGLDSPPHHLSRFSPASMERLLERLGLTILFHAEQTSSFDLIRNFAGSLFRKKSAQSMRGGEFRNMTITKGLRMAANRSKNIVYRITAPIDAILRLFGIRYISQIVVAQKSS